MNDKKLTRNLLSVSIADEINKMIIDKNMEPGAKLPNEKELAEIYRVSRPTIREAMKALKARNVVVIRQGDGTYVCDRTGIGEDPLGLRYVEKEMLSKGIFEARLLIEPMIAMLAAQRATESDLREMGSNIELMQRTDYRDPARSELDLQFHTLLAKCSKNPVFIQLMPVIYETIEKGFIILYSSEESHISAQKMHKEIYEACVCRDPLRAKFATETHIYTALYKIHAEEMKGRH